MLHPMPIKQNQYQQLQLIEYASKSMARVLKKTVFNVLMGLFIECSIL